MNAREIAEAVEEARALRHPDRAMRVLLECGHLRLIEWRYAAGAIGDHTSCALCPPQPNGYPVARLVVNVEETGVLHDSVLNEGGKG